VHRGILPPKAVREVLGEEFTAEEIAAGFAALREDYAGRDGALVLVEIAGGYQFGTRTDLAPWIKKLDFYEHHRHLSRRRWRRCDHRHKQPAPGRIGRFAA
jgi:chromosome segregation and condensation protein ScpB